MTSHRPFWREPMVWLVFGLPLFAVVASLLLVFAAVRSSGNDALVEPAQQTAPLP